MLEPRRRGRSTRPASFRSPTSRCLAWDHQPDGGRPNMTVDEFHECGRGAAPRPARDRGAGGGAASPTWDRVLIDTWAYGAAPGPRGHTAAGASAGRDVWYRESAGGEPVREPGDRAALRHRPQPDGAARGRGHPTGGVDEPHTDGGVRAAPRARPRAARGRQAARDQRSPRASRSRSTATCCAGRSGRCAWASTTAREWCSTPWATTTAGARAPVAHRLSFAEMVVPYRDPTDRPLPPHGVRHRRVGPGAS